MRSCPPVTAAQTQKVCNRGGLLQFFSVEVSPLLQFFVCASVEVSSSIAVLLCASFEVTSSVAVLCLCVGECFLLCFSSLFMRRWRFPPLLQFFFVFALVDFFCCAAVPCASLEVSSSVAVLCTSVEISASFAILLCFCVGGGDLCYSSCVGVGLLLICRLCVYVGSFLLCCNSSLFVHRWRSYPLLQVFACACVGEVFSSVGILLCVCVGEGSSSVAVFHLFILCCSSSIVCRWRSPPL